MTATAEFITAAPAPSVSVRITDGGRMLVRGAQRLAGAALALAAVGLWLAPGASWESDIMLFKLVLSAAAGLAGLALVQASRSQRTPDAEIDTIRREIRLVRRGLGGVDAVLQRCAFADLSRAERRGSNVRLWDQGGGFLAEVTLTDRAALSSLMAGLRDAGKIV